MLKPNANELSSYIVQVSLTDEDGGVVVPISLSWTLTDIAGTVVNGRQGVVIESPGRTSTIVLAGDDLAVDGYYSGMRVLRLDGRYPSTLATEGLPVSAVTVFDIERLVAVEGAQNRIRDMSQLLSVYFSDPEMRVVPPAMRVALLNRGQDIAVPLIARHRLHVLDALLPGQTLDSTGGFDLSLLVNPVFRGDAFIDGVQTSNGKFASLISFDERRQALMAGRAFNASEPKYYIRSGKVMLCPFAAGDWVDIHYMRKPAEMVLEASPATSVDCEFENDIQDVIVALAAEIGLKYILKDLKLSEQARMSAMDSILAINATAPPTDTIHRGEEVFPGDGEINLNVNWYTV